MLTLTYSLKNDTLVDLYLLAVFKETLPVIGRNKFPLSMNSM